MNEPETPSPIPNDPPDPDEGLIVEPEEEVEPGEGVEPEEEPELVEPAEEGPTPKQLAAIERAHTAHERKLREIMGPAFALFEPCPTCEAAGFVPTGMPVAEELVELPGAIECPACHGNGRLRTPSKVEGQKTQVCVACAGAGWKYAEATPAEPTQTTAAPVANGAPSVAGLPAGYIAVKIDPNAPDLPAASYPSSPVPAPAA